MRDGLRVTSIQPVKHTLKVCLLAVMLTGGCATAPKELYYWGNYETLLYQMYNNPGEATAVIQVDKLEQDINRAEASGKNVPPGLYAHLGIMYASLGKLADAEAAFEEEKSRFPESAILIDGMMQRAHELSTRQ